MILLLILTITLLAFNDNVDGARILGIFPHVGRSHQMVFEPYLQKLAERGHQVTVVSFFPRNIRIENYTDVSLVGLAPVNIEAFDMKLFESGSMKIEKHFLLDFMHTLEEVKLIMTTALHVCSNIIGYPPLEAVLKKEYDLVIVENFNSDCVFGLLHVHKVKAPIVGLLSTSLMPWSSERMGLFENPAYVPSFFTSNDESMNYLQRVHNTFQSLISCLLYRYMIQVKEQALLEQRYGKIPDLQELGSKFSLLLVNSFHSLSGVRPTLPGIVEVGGMHLSNKTDSLPKHIEKFLNESDHGVVLISFGSLLKTSTMSKYKEELMINALSKLKQRVIWKFESSADEGTLIGNNILRVKWLPQYQLLQHKKVLAFVGHGGILGVTEVLSVGKPMLVVPFFGDQHFNGKRATKAGLATVLPFNEMTEESFYKALQKILSLEMRLNARQASEIWLDRPAKPMETAIYWTERVIRWGVNAPLHSPARDLNVFQILLLDIIFVFLLLFVVLCIIVKLMFTSVKRIFTRTSKKQKTQ